MTLKTSQLSFEWNVAPAVPVARAVDVGTSEQSFGLVVVICLIFMLSPDNARQEGKQTQYRDLCIQIR